MKILSSSTSSSRRLRSIRKERRERSSLKLLKKKKQSSISAVLEPTNVEEMEMEMFKLQQRVNDKLANSMPPPEQFHSFLKQQQQQPLYLLWNDLEDAILSYAPQWTHPQRSKLLSSLIQFLELKVLMKDYSVDDDDDDDGLLLLAPTILIGRAWYAIAIHEELYTSLTRRIQDYHHHQQYKPIHRPPLTLDQEDDLAYQQRMELTQRLFICYHQQAMPETLREIDMDLMRGNNNQSDHAVIVQENDDASSGSEFENDDDDDDDDDEIMTALSVVSQESTSWIHTFTSWLSCWKDPFPEASSSEEHEWGRKRSNDDTNSTAQLTTMDEQDPGHGQNGGGGGGGDDFWVVFDHAKVQEQKDDMTLLTIDSIEKERRREERLRRNVLGREEKRRTNNKKQPIKILPKEKKQLEKEEQDKLKGWQMFKSQLRIAVMILKELE